MIKEHLSLEVLSRNMKEACSINQFRRWQVIFLRLKSPEMSVHDIAELCTVPYRTITHWTWLYNTKGPDAYILLGRGGRRRFHLPVEAEQEILQSVREKAERGIIVTAQTVKLLAEKKIGHELPKDYAYDLLHRNHWRKIMPHTYHPKGNEEAQVAFKKTTRISWLPPEKN
jgi:Transposase and inactivated derivatives